MESWIDSEENEVEDEEDKNAEHLDSPDVDDEDSIDFDEKVSKRYIKKDVTRNGYIANNRLLVLLWLDEHHHKQKLYLKMPREFWKKPLLFNLKKILILKNTEIKQ